MTEVARFWHSGHEVPSGVGHSYSDPAGGGLNQFFNNGSSITLEPYVDDYAYDWGNMVLLAEGYYGISLMAIWQGPTTTPGSYRSISWHLATPGPGLPIALDSPPAQDTIYEASGEFGVHSTPFATRMVPAGGAVVMIGLGQDSGDDPLTVELDLHVVRLDGAGGGAAAELFRYVPQIEQVGLDKGVDRRVIMQLLERDRQLEDHLSRLTTPTLTGISRRYATVTVAASDATADWRATADFVCDGVADEATIQAAIDQVANSSPYGGKVLLSEGSFLLQSDYLSVWGNVLLDGMGHNGSFLNGSLGGGLTRMVHILNGQVSRLNLHPNDTTTDGAWLMGVGRLNDVTIRGHGTGVGSARGLYVPSTGTPKPTAWGLHIHGFAANKGIEVDTATLVCTASRNENGQTLTGGGSIVASAI